MKKTAFFLLLPVIFISCRQSKYPVTRKVDQVDNYFGTLVYDPYRWLENDSSAEVEDWAQAQNKLTTDYLNKIPYRLPWQKRIQEVYNYAKYTAPFRNGEYLYFYKNDGLQNQSVLYRQKGLTGQPELIIDPNKLSADGTTELTVFSLSRKGNYAAYGVSIGGSDWQTYYVRDMTTNKDLGDTLQWVKVSNIGWQDSGFYYSRYPAPTGGEGSSAANLNHQVYYHMVGTAQSVDKLIYEDTANPKRFNIASTSEDERYTYLSISDRGKGFDGNSLWFKDNKNPGITFSPLVGQITNYTYNAVDNIGSNFLVQTNDNAPNYKLVLINPQNTDSTAWKTFVPEKPEAMQEVSTSGGKVFLNYLKDVTSRVYVYNLAGAMEKEVILPALGTADGFSGLDDDTTVFYTFNSYTYPPTVLRYSIATGQTYVFQQPTITNYNEDDFETKQVFFNSKDGTRVPMFLTYKKGLKLDGKSPVLLYGYGGFDYSLVPTFDATLIPWMEQGGIYGVANIRGGSEYGEQWHQAGMLLKKQNVFDDFIAAIEFLHTNKYTSPEYTTIQGASNGGLLVGAVMNQRPNLVKIGIAEVGVMDMLRFQKFTIGWNWIPEYGSSDDSVDFRNLYAYSPLHNIKPGTSYPATFITTADHDDRVVPAHSFKYAATLQAAQKGENPVLMKVIPNTGHGAPNTSNIIELAADMYSFIFYNTGLKPVFK